MATNKTVKISMSEDEYKALLTFKKATCPDDVTDDLYFRQLFFKGCEWLSSELNRGFTDEVDRDKAAEEGKALIESEDTEEKSDEDEKA